MTLRFKLQLNDYYIFDNWKLDPDGGRILSSKFHTSWKVIDTSAVVAGYQGVAIVVDSTFARDVWGVDSLVRTDYRYFRTSSVGDVFEFGFIARLLQQRETTLVNPKWDKLLSPSAVANTPWTVETNDSLAGGNVYARFFLPLELAGTPKINGVSTGVFAYHVEFEGRDLTLHLWLSDTPSAFLRFWDDSDTVGDRVFQELVLIQTSH